jgi:very-short-patch-repair endonuclease
LYAVVDLGSEELQLAVEADGFEHHGTRQGLRKDCRRHTELSVFGWSSLRFTFEDVMYEPAWVRWALNAWRDVRAGRAPGNPPARSSGRVTAA